MANHPSRPFGRREFFELVLGTTALGAAAASPFAALAQAAGGAKLKIATIGSGREGGALGTPFAKAGHPLMFSSRHPEQLKDLVDERRPAGEGRHGRRGGGVWRCRPAGRAVYGGRPDRQGFRRGVRREAVGHRCQQPDRAPRRRRFRQIGQRPGRRRAGHGEVAAGREDCAGVQRASAPARSPILRSARARRSACRSPATTRARSRWRAA